jgi:hypothetical protein
LARDGALAELAEEIEKVVGDAFTKSSVID